MDIGIACAFETAQSGQLREAIETAAVAAEELGFASWWGLADRDVAPTTSHDATLGLMCVARATRRMRIGLAGDALSVRAAAVRAKQLASLDWFSGGRLEIGVDLDAPPAELVKPGTVVADPVECTIDRLGAMETLWTERRGNYTSPTLSFAGAISNPKTVGDRRLRVHLRHASTPVLHRVLEARGAIEAWIAWKLDPAALTAGLADLASSLPTDHGPVRRTWFVDPPLVATSREQATEAGLDELVAVFDHVPGPTELREVMA